MLFQRDAAEQCVPGRGRRADAKSGISHDSTIYNVFRVSLSRSWSARASPPAAARTGNKLFVDVQCLVTSVQAA